MNWVGGSRNRLMMKNDTKKQREFFEKRRMQNKLKNLEVATPSSPKVSSFASMDLVTLFVVNQIAAKKELKDPPQVSVLGSKGGGKKWSGNKPLVLPMSPGSPSQLSLVESQPQCRVQGVKTKKIVPQAFKIRPLSPVVECSFSDNSAADYLPPIAEPLSPFSSSSSSSGRIFPQRPQSQPLPGWSLTPWDTSSLDQNLFQPFFEPRGIQEDIVWSSNPATPSAAFFGTPETPTHYPRSEDTFLSHLSQIEPTLDFTLNQTGNEHHFEEDVFPGLINDEYESDAYHFGSETTKAYLKDETSIHALTPQTVPEPQSVGVQLPSCSLNFTCPEYPMNVRGCSPSSFCKRPYLSSASSDVEECCYSLGFPERRAPPDSPEMCACKKRPSEKRDAETQTIHESTSDKSDVATQCSLLSDTFPPVVSLQQDATRGHLGCTESPVEREAKTGGRRPLWRKKKSNLLSILNTIRQCHSRMSSQMPLQDILSKISMQQSPLEKAPPDEAREENGTAIGAEEESLWKIADILLPRMQRKDVE
ncbi:uncharacterized protein redic1 isoform X2 [Hippocampus comes]|uniref:uncharacterized protein redic1 isoform X2 n=1 Tax=Hippocampus comes TaxID=109280 RepID=UPI00094E0D2F|nr:PREDICTED: uncharacterized protein C12orf40 homolog isoform X2 [Hippocampus comes]